MAIIHREAERAIIHREARESYIHREARESYIHREAREVYHGGYASFLPWCIYLPLLLGR